MLVKDGRGERPLGTAAEWAWWYQYYFATDRGESGLGEYRHDFAKLIWRNVSSTWHFDDATFDRTAAAFDNPGYVSIVIHNYRWRLGLAMGDPRYDGIEAKLAAGPGIACPPSTLDSAFDPFTPQLTGAHTAPGSPTPTPTARLKVVQLRGMSLAARQPVKFPGVNQHSPTRVWSHRHFLRAREAGITDIQLEVVVVPVSDVDRAGSLHTALGRRRPVPRRS